MNAEQITEAQRRLRDRHGMIVVPRCRAHFRAIARWWEFEAMRGYQSSERSAGYARTYRWLVELMDAGRRVTADARGVYIDGDLVGDVLRSNERAETKRLAAQERRAKAAALESARPPNPFRTRRGEP